MLVRATMNVRNASVRCQDLQKPVPNISRIRPAMRCWAQHLPDQRQNVWNGTESVFVMFARSFFNYNHPALDFIQIDMERRVCASALTARGGFLLR